MGLGRIAISAAFHLAIAAVFVACSSSTDTLSLDEYFKEFEAIDAAADAQTEALFSDYPEGDFFDDEQLPFIKDLMASFLRITSDSIDRFRDLDPPSKVEDAHNEFVNVSQDLIVAFETANDTIQDAATMAEYETINEEVSAGIEAIVTRFDGACLAIVDIAVANGIRTNITCEDG